MSLFDPKAKSAEELNRLYDLQGYNLAKNRKFPVPNSELSREVARIKEYKKSSDIISYRTNVYGEITRAGCEQMISELRNYINRETVFYDFGSGYGTCALHMSIRTDIKKATGIENNLRRFAWASGQINGYHYRSSIPPLFTYADIFDGMSNYNDATFVYWDNTMFNDSSYRDRARSLLTRLPYGCVVVVRDISFFPERNWNSFWSPTSYTKDGSAKWTIIR